MLCISLLASVANGVYTYPDSADNGWTGTCDSGGKQSPINIVTADAKENEKVELNWQDIGSLQKQKPTLTISTNNDMKQFRVDMNDNGKVTYYINTEGDEKLYRLTYLEIHTPSEHQVDGTHYDAEIQFVHKSDKDKDGNQETMVMSIFYDNQDGTTCYRHLDLVDELELKTRQDATEDKDFQINFLKMKEELKLLSDQTFYHYEGSLTAPPCTEDVQWFVMKEPLGISEENVKGLREFCNYDPKDTTNKPGNARTVQTYSQGDLEKGMASNAQIVAVFASLCTTILAIFC